MWEIFLLGAPGLDFDLVEERRRRVSAAEAVRALYVAVTRPRERLVLAGSWPGHRDAPPPDRAKSLLDLLESREGKRTDLEAFFDAAREGREGTSRDEGGARWFFPALEAPAPPVRTDALPPSGDLLPRARRAAKELARARESARERMVRPYQGTASERSHEVLRELLADAAPEGETEPGELDFAARSQALREIALAAGTAVHHALERFDLAALPERELERQRGLLAAHLATFLPPGRVEEVRADADRVLAGLAGSKILARLREIAPRVLGREVPVLLPGDENEGPVGVRVGTLDLLYEDPADGSLVVADYKTDSAPTPADIEERARAYAPQGATYLAAVRRALGESRAVRFELWFLAADRIELVATG
ncbi:MAG: PD-(D/E)XK nuclease family protein [Planctomycetes bacterium]|nr:PD-(D/E)XK nuclease family protein [Planctomycetota bacterium]